MRGTRARTRMEMHDSGPAGKRSAQLAPADAAQTPVVGNETMGLAASVTGCPDGQGPARRRAMVAPPHTARSRQTCAQALHRSSAASPQACHLSPRYPRASGKPPLQRHAEPMPLHPLFCLLPVVPRRCSRQPQGRQARARARAPLHAIPASCGLLYQCWSANLCSCAAAFCSPLELAEVREGGTPLTIFIVWMQVRVQRQHSWDE